MTQTAKGRTTEWRDAKSKSRDDGLYEKSNWNLFLDRKLDLGRLLGTEEHRLADAIARYTLGYRTVTRPIGEQLLRLEADLDGRSFTRARQGLVEKGLIQYDSGRRGRGHRTVYTLVLRADEETRSRPSSGVRG